MVVRVAVVDPLPLYRHGVGATLAEAGIRTEAPEDLVAWAGVDEPRLVLFTVTAADGWAYLSTLCRVRAETKIIAVLEEASVHACVRALSAGAAAVLARDAPPRIMREVFDAAVRDNSLVPTSVLRALTDAGTPDPNATGSSQPMDAEKEWLRQLARGDSVARLAVRAGYSERMMFRLLRDLYTKIGVSGRTEALIKARGDGWL